MIRIATRASDLALWQARRVQELLGAAGQGSELVTVTTQGDRDQRPFAELGGTGFFTKAVQDAVLEGRADIAVHSYKDLPSAGVPGLTIAAVPERADPRDVLLVDPGAHDAGAGPVPLVEGALVGTSAARRRAQLHSLRPDLELMDLRGNVPTRVAKLRRGDYQAVVLAKAGLDRLDIDLSGLVVHVLEPQVLMPAPAQGALAVETVERLVDVVRLIDDAPTRRVVAAERDLMARFDAGCQLALGARAVPEGGGVRLSAWYEGRRAEAWDADPVNASKLVFEALGVDEAESRDRTRAGGGTATVTREGSMA